MGGAVGWAGSVGVLGMLGVLGVLQDRRSCDDDHAHTGILGRFEASGVCSHIERPTTHHGSGRQSTSPSFTLLHPPSPAFTLTHPRA